MQCWLGNIARATTRVNGGRNCESDLLVTKSVTVTPAAASGKRR